MRMKVFFDSNVFLKYLAGVEDAKRLMDRVEHDKWKGYINDIVISEVVYGYLRLALNVSRYKLRKYIVKNRVRELLEQDIYPLFTDFEHLPTNIGIDSLIEYMTKYKLLPNDALIVATCRAYNIENIATFDEDFKRVPWLRVIP